MSKAGMATVAGLAVLAVLLAVGLAMGWTAGPVAAQEGNPPVVDPGQVPALPDFLGVLAGPVGWVALGVLFSAALAKWPWFNAQGDAVKRALPVALAVAAAVTAKLLLVYVPAVFWESVAEYWKILAGIGLTWFGSQAWFRVVVKPQRSG